VFNTGASVWIYSSMAPTAAGLMGRLRSPASMKLGLKMGRGNQSL
jgi:hypothetical protein